MEQNLPVVAKKAWSLVRAILFIIKKNTCNRKLLLDLNMIMMKRGKIARKAMQNLKFNHHHNWSTFTFNRHSNTPNFTFPPPPTDEYEFSCSNTPVYPLSLFTTNKKHRKHNKTSHNKYSDVHNDEHNQIFVDPAMIKALEMITASPVVSGFGKSPMVRQLRVTDSPFSLSNGDEDSYVDEAAEKFIMKFYNDLRRGN